MASSPRVSTFTSHWYLQMLKGGLDPVEHLLCMRVVSVIIRPSRRRASLNASMIHGFGYTSEVALIREGTRHSNAVFVICCVHRRLDAAELDVGQVFFIIKLP